MWYSKTIESGISKAVNGVYNQKVWFAIEYIDDQRFEDAERLIEQAADYLEMNRDHISDHNEFEQIYKKIKAGRYNDLIDKGRKFLDMGKYNYAFQKLEQALYIEKENDLSPVPLLRYYLRQSVKPLLIAGIDYAQRLVWINELDSAAQIYNNTLEEQLVYGLSEDEEIMKAVARLKMNLFSKTCQNTHIQQI